MLVDSCGFEVSHQPFRLGEKRKKMITSPKFPWEPAASAPLPPSRAPPLGRFLNMMNCRGQPRSALCPGEPALGSVASLPLSSRPACCKCPRADNVTAAAFPLSQRRRRKSPRGMCPLSGPAEQREEVGASESGEIALGQLGLEWPPQDSSFASFLVGTNSTGGCVMNMPGALDSLSHTHSQRFAVHLAIAANIVEAVISYCMKWGIQNWKTTSNIPLHSGWEACIKVNVLSLWETHHQVAY